MHTSYNLLIDEALAVPAIPNLCPQALAGTC